MIREREREKKERRATPATTMGNKNIQVELGWYLKKMQFKQKRKKKKRREREKEEGKMDRRNSFNRSNQMDCHQ